MTDFAANVHFRASSRGDIAGGYGWFLGRFAEWTEFEAEIQRQLQSFGYYYVECLTLVELDSEADLSEVEQKRLYRELDVHPIRWRTLHTYLWDDA